VCVPSDSESFGLANVEAAQNEKPIVAVDIPPVREVVGNAGILCKKEPKSIARAINSLLASSQKRKKLGINGRKRFKSNFSNEAVINRTEQALDRCFV